MQRLVVLLCLAFLAACDKEATQTMYDPPEKEPQMSVPSFQIQITLSDRAAKKLRDAHETIKGAVYFDGDGTSRPDEYTAPMRPVVLGSYYFELPEAGTVSVTDATISQAAFKRLTDQDYYYTLNVYSGRRAFKDNVLSGGYSETHISEALKQPIQVTCDLLTP
jgi:hypothetical protein